MYWQCIVQKLTGELVPFRIIFLLIGRAQANWIVDFLMMRPTWTFVCRAFNEFILSNCMSLYAYIFSMVLSFISIFVWNIQQRTVLNSCDQFNGIELNRIGPDRTTVTYSQMTVTNSFCHYNKFSEMHSVSLRHRNKASPYIETKSHAAAYQWFKIEKRRKKTTNATILPKRRAINLYDIYATCHSYRTH